MLRTSAYTDIDKLYMLWLLCVIDERQNDQQSLSPKSMKNEFGEEMININVFYMNELLELKLIVEEYQLDTKSYKIKLTQRGQKIVSNWQKHSDTIRML
jgi:cell fate regulator YaaT (PSP1 superfamily)